MKIYNLPPVGEIWKHAHPLAHTFEEVLFDVKVKKINERLVGFKQKGEWATIVPSSLTRRYSLLLFYQGKQAMLCIYRPRYGSGSLLGERGDLCELSSSKARVGYPNKMFFIPLVTDVLVVSGQEPPKMIIPGAEESSGVREWHITSQVFNHEYLGQIYLAPSPDA